MRTIVLAADRQRRDGQKSSARRSDNGETLGNNRWLGKVLRGVSSKERLGLGARIDTQGHGDSEHHRHHDSPSKIW